MAVGVSGAGRSWAAGVRAGSRRCSGQEAARWGLGCGGLQTLYAQQGPQHALRGDLRAQVLVSGSAEATRGSHSFGVCASREDPPQQIPAGEQSGMQ